MEQQPEVVNKAEEKMKFKGMQEVELDYLFHVGEVGYLIHAQWIKQFGTLLWVFTNKTPPSINDWFVFLDYFLFF